MIKTIKTKYKKIIKPVLYKKNGVAAGRDGRKKKRGWQFVMPQI